MAEREEIRLKLKAIVAERNYARSKELFAGDPTVLSQLGDSHVAWLARHSLLAAKHFTHIGLGYPIRAYAKLADWSGPMPERSEEQMMDDLRQSPWNLERMADQMAREWKAQASREAYSRWVDEQA